MQPLDAAATRRLRKGTRVFDRAQLRAIIPAVIGLVVLAAVSASTHWRPAAAPELPGLPMDRAPLETLRETHELRAVRHSLDAYRFVEGRWPDELAELGERGLDGAASLASGGPRAYYYVTRKGDALLLAPER